MGGALIGGVEDYPVRMLSYAVSLLNQAPAFRLCPYSAESRIRSLRGPSPLGGRVFSGTASFRAIRHASLPLRPHPQVPPDLRGEGLGLGGVYFFIQGEQGAAAAGLQHSF